MKFVAPVGKITSCPLATCHLPLLPFPRPPPPTHLLLPAVQSSCASLGRRANKLIDLCHEPCRQSVLIFSCSRGAVFAFSFFIFSWLLLIMGVQHRPLPACSPPPLSKLLAAISNFNLFMYAPQLERSFSSTFEF